jgi:hypothetical protein
LIEKGINVTSLFQSDIFCHQFDCEDWPAIHFDSGKYTVPYNSSVFDIKHKYQEVFGYLHSSKASKDGKVYKIKYTMNLLPCVTYQDGACEGVNDLLDCLIGSEEHCMFETKIVKDFFDFQWNSYAKFLHFYGAAVHFLYLFLFVFYVN